MLALVNQIEWLDSPNFEKLKWRNEGTDVCSQITLYSLYLTFYDLVCESIELSLLT